MTLHDAMVDVLADARRPLRAAELAAAINDRGLYSRRDGQPLPSSQISARVRNYPELFVVVGDRVWLTSGADVAVLDATPAPVRGPRFSAASDASEVEVALLADDAFRAAGRVDALVPDAPGLYAIRVTGFDVLPSPFREEARRRGDRLIYIGEAKVSLRRRLLGQELRARGHGTFFRSLGAVLGFRPASGSLIGKANPRNFVFTPVDEQAIIDWINRHLEVSWVPFEGDIHAAESALLRAHAPLLNLTGNRRAMPELSALRAACVRVALAR